MIYPVEMVFIQMRDKHNVYHLRFVLKSKRVVNLMDKMFSSALFSTVIHYIENSFVVFIKELLTEKSTLPYRM